MLIRSVNFTTCLYSFPIRAKKSHIPDTPCGLFLSVFIRGLIRDNPLFGWSDIERHRKGKSYTIDTLNELAAMKQYGDILLLIGGDSLRQLHLWYRAHDLVRDYGLIVYPRPNEPVTRAELLEHWSAAETDKLLGSLMDSVPEFPVSSTQIRENMKKNGINGISAFVTSAVADYITRQNLYL